MHASNGILFNHESPRRGETFVTRKITRALARIKAGLQKELYLGNLDAKRDWGYAPEYVEAMWLMLQQDRATIMSSPPAKPTPSANSSSRPSVASGLDWNKYVKIDPRYYRPAEVDLLIGDASKARKILGWQPKTTFADLVRIMVKADQELLALQLSGKDIRVVEWNMKPNDAIYVAGHRGMVGAALVRLLRARGFTNLLLRTRAEMDLCDPAAVRAFYEKNRPDYVFFAAARVGGIMANSTLPVEFLSENLQIQLNLINGAYANEVKKLLFLGSSCIYPKLAPQPIPEESFLPAASSRPTRPTPWPKSAASGFARPIVVNMARISSPPCQPISTAPRIISTSKLRTSCRP